MYNITHVHLFADRIAFDVVAGGDAQVTVNSIGGLFCKGYKEQCMADIRNFVVSQPIAGKTLVFNLSNSATSGQQAVIGDDTKAYFRGQLNMLKASARCNIIVNSGLRSYKA